MTALLFHGRHRMKVALLGYAQAGKKTLFTLLTGRDIPPNRKEQESVEGCADCSGV